MKVSFKSILNQTRKFKEALAQSVEESHLSKEKDALTTVDEENQTNSNKEKEMLT